MRAVLALVALIANSFVCNAASPLQLIRILTHLQKILNKKILKKFIGTSPYATILV